MDIAEQLVTNPQQHVVHESTLRRFLVHHAAFRAAVTLAECGHHGQTDRQPNPCFRSPSRLPTSAFARWSG